MEAEEVNAMFIFCSSFPVIIFVLHHCSDGTICAQTCANIYTYGGQFYIQLVLTNVLSGKIAAILCETRLYFIFWS